MVFKCIPRTFRSNNCCRRATYWTLGIIFILGTVLLMIVLLSLCVNQKVEQDEYAVFINGFTTDVRGVFTQGTYTSDVGDTIVRFKRTFQLLEYDPLECMSYDQLILSLTISLQFQYAESAIMPIILMQFDTEDNFKNFLIGKIADSIISTCGNYTAEDYYSIRGSIETTMYNSVISQVNMLNIGLDIIFLQLKNIDFPDDFATAITTKQLIEQQTVTQLNSRTSQLITANTTYLSSLQTANIILISANNTAEINIQQAHINEQIIINQWAQRAIAYNSIKQNLGLNASSLINYLEYEIIRNGNAPVVNIQAL